MKINDLAVLINLDIFNVMWSHLKDILFMSLCPIAFLSKNTAVHLSRFLSITLHEMYVYAFLFACVVMDSKSCLRVSRYRMFIGQK